MAVGRSTCSSGLPTLNHCDSVGAVVRAAHVAFNRELAAAAHRAPERRRRLDRRHARTRARRVASSTARRSSRRRACARATASARPYHGVPGKASALRTVFAAADLLQARAVVVLDPEVASVSAETVAALARPALDGAAEFVSPAYSRHPLDGTLVTQVVRPLFRGGVRARAAGAAGGGVRAARERSRRGASRSRSGRCDELRLAIDLWISGAAALDAVRVAEVALGPRRLAARPRPAVAGLVPQVLRGALHQPAAAGEPVDGERADTGRPEARSAAGAPPRGRAGHRRRRVRRALPGGRGGARPGARPRHRARDPRRTARGGRGRRSSAPARRALVGGRGASSRPRTGTARSRATTSSARPCRSTSAASPPSPPRRP